ncbi:adenylate/guanylate cyclase domain-containing protein [Mycolicibacter sp. MYC123]|uniref:Adenylate/guanylate cyclase domain-containing protein n=1 Tax=[Mycobacterium] zoologicum TaxID=2872311 RepID=A0ABU5YGC4_9MYCO|nr:MULTISPECIES: adenylate/guanylate cyclase domain-containing protein [unclassified Mycolicibacter]MEB3049101.1 adenylate/guanylate cyclase domain-containing protein [Mycolicibacter sp. MYC123]MEB3061665.1 adenylate/guanylate cyclase domain-containing protein [Mycolicibacter sp. MYC101]
MDSAPSAGVENIANDAARRWRLGSRLSIQTKLMLILLLTSIASVGIVGFVEFQYGAAELQRSVTSKLVQAREAQRRAVINLFAEMTNSLVILSGGEMAANAVEAFTAGFDELAHATVTPDQQRAIEGYYRDKFVQSLAERTGERADVAALLPTSPAQRYLQARYTAGYTGASPKTEDTGDHGAWSAANARFNSMFSEIVARNEILDALLLDTRGNVVYTVAKGVDLGTNVLTGPYRESPLRDAYRKVLASNAVNFVWITDYQPYQPALDTPTAWLVSPVGTGGTVEGVLALPLPSAKVNRVMTANRDWKAAQVGRTTETYLAGADDLMRSDSRLFLEDPERYRREAVAAGTPTATVDKALRLGTTTLVQPVGSPALRDAQRGQTDTLNTGYDYLGNRELVAYAPLTIPNSELQWSILATRDYSDAYAGVTSFSRRVVLATTGVVVAICVLAMLLARFFLQPIRRLQVAAQRISAGDYSAAVPTGTADEIGDLTRAFNQMSHSLRTKEELLNEQRRQNDELLLSLMPESVVRRYRGGEQAIAEEHHNVSVVYAELQGIDQLSAEASANELVTIVDELVRQFDAAAEGIGVERIRTMYNGYLAGCGLTTPRLDGVHRIVDFACEMQRIVERFNAKSGHKLNLWAGVNTGEVVSGLVGRSGVTYDLWGSAVNLAYQLRRGTPQTGIYVTGAVRDMLGAGEEFSLVGTVSLGETEEQAWAISEPS